MDFRQTAFILLSVIGLLASGSRAEAETFTASPGDDIERMVNALTPGDELVLNDGMYVLDDSRFTVDVTGTEEQPIVWRAAEGASPHIHRPNATRTSSMWTVRSGSPYTESSFPVGQLDCG